MELSLVRSLLGGQAECEEYNDAANDDRCLEYDKPRRDDKWALNVIRKCLSEESGTALQCYDRRERSEALRTLKGHGLTVRQIERLTGINRNIVQKA